MAPPRCSTASTSVGDGTVLALLGPNGAGKTTAVRILATLTQPDAGVVRNSGHDVVAEPASVRSLISLTGQYAAVDGQQTGRENLVMLGQLWHLGRSRAGRRAGELLERLTWPTPPTGESTPGRAACAGGSIWP